MKIFSIFDSKAEAFLRPFFAETPGLAERAVLQACVDPNHEFHKYGGDFNLFYIGKFDEQMGRVSPLDAPINHGNLLQMRLQHEAASRPAMMAQEALNDGE